MLSVRFFIVMLNGILLIVIMLKVIMMSIIMLKLSERQFAECYYAVSCGNRNKTSNILLFITAI
jgi:hypothetical protein